MGSRRSSSPIGPLFSGWKLRQLLCVAGGWGSGGWSSAGTQEALPPSRRCYRSDPREVI